MNKYNQRHKRDLTTHPAIEGIDRDVHQSASRLVHLIYWLSRSAGFRVMDLHLLHIRTGTTVGTHKPSKEEEHVSI